MPEIKTEFLFTIAFEVQVFNLGDTPQGGRRIVRLGTGSFEGPKLKGTVLPGGGGWSLMRRDDVLEIGGHGLALETDDKQHIYMTWKGFRHGPKEVIDRLNRGETVDPETVARARKSTAGRTASARSPPARARRAGGPSRCFRCCKGMQV